MEKVLFDPSPPIMSLLYRSVCSLFSPLIFFSINHVHSCLPHQGEDCFQSDPCFRTGALVAPGYMEKRQETSEKHKYWNEIPLTKQQFFKIMLNDFEHKLFIPRKFMDNFKGKLTAWCTLKGQSGYEWRVAVAKDKKYPDRTVFLDVWAEFVRDHCIKATDFLVFRYVGHSSFKVIVFDGSGCERESSYYAKTGSKSQINCTSTLHLEKDLRNPYETNESECSTKSILRKSESYEEGETGDDYSGFSSEEEEDDQCSPQFRMTNIRRGKSTRAKISQMYYISNRRKLREEEKQRATLMASTHKPKCSRGSMFRITMKPTHVYRGFNLTIPKSWASKHMLHNTPEVNLRVPSVRKSWRVGCRWTIRSNQCQLRPNWPMFVFENTLEEHDTCVFELRKNRKSGNNTTTETAAIFDVYIYRVIDEIVPLTVSRRMA